jgi:hypothetical protein
LQDRKNTRPVDPAQRLQRARCDCHQRQSIAFSRVRIYLSEI